MENVCQIDKVMLSALRHDLDAALIAIAEKHGLTLKVGNISFTERTFVAKVEGALLNADGSATDRRAEDFKRYAHMFGLEPEWLGRTFKWGGREFKVAGLNTKGKTMPVIGERADGKRFKFTVESVQLSLRK